MKSTKLPGTVALTRGECAALKAYVNKHGEASAIVALEVSRPTLIRACGGFTIRRGSAKILRGKLEELTKPEPPAELPPVSEEQVPA